MPTTDWNRVDALSDDEIEQAAAADPDSVLLDVHGTGVFEVYQDPERRFYWRLHAGNGRIIADGVEGYGSLEEARRAIAYLKASLDAPVRLAA